MGGETTRKDDKARQRSDSEFKKFSKSPSTSFPIEQWYSPEQPEIDVKSGAIDLIRRYHQKSSTIVGNRVNFHWEYPLKSSQSRKRAPLRHLDPPRGRRVAANNGVFVDDDD